MQKDNWFTSNMWNIIVTAIGMIAVASVLMFRVNLLEARFAEYPSQDWFELKFEMIDKKFVEVQKQFDKVDEQFVELRNEIKKPCNL